MAALCWQNTQLRPLDDRRWFRQPFRSFWGGPGEGVFAKSSSPETFCLSAPDEFDDDSAPEHQSQKRECGANQPQDRFDALEAFTQAAVLVVAVVFKFRVTFVAATLEVIQPDFQSLQFPELPSILVLDNCDFAVKQAQFVAHLFEHHKNPILMFGGWHGSILEETQSSQRERK